MDGGNIRNTLPSGALDYLKKRDIAFKIHAGGEAEGNASNIFKADDHVLTAKYSVYGGIENFKNLWLWLLQRFCALELEYNQPQQMLWNGIYHPNADKVYTRVNDYRAFPIQVFTIPVQTPMQAIDALRNGCLWEILFTMLCISLARKRYHDGYFVLF